MARRDADHRAPPARPVEGGPATLADRGPHPLRRRGALRRRAHERADGRGRDPRAARAPRPAARRATATTASFNSLTTDKIAIALDPYHNHLDEVWFEINPAGVRGDQFNGDPSWDPVWEGAAHIDADGWTAEMRIPYSQLRFSRDERADVGAAGVALRRPAQRAGHVVVPQPRRERRPGVLRAPRGARRERAGRGRPSCCRTSCRSGQFKYADARAIRTHDSRDMKRQRRRRHQVQPDVEPHARRDDQSRLRPGRGRSGVAQPLGVRDVLRREAALLRRQSQRVQLRRHELHTSAATSPGLGVLLLAAHRPAAAAQRVGRRTSATYRRRAGRRDDPRRGEDHRAHAAAATPSACSTRSPSRETARYITALGRPRADADRRAAHQLLHGPRAEGAACRARRRSASSRRPPCARLGGDTVLTSQLREQRDRASASTGATRGSNRDVPVARQRRRRPTCAARPNAIALTQRSSTHYFQRPDREVTTRRPVRHALRHHRDVAARLRPLLAAREGERQLAVGGCRPTGAAPASR